MGKFGQGLSDEIEILRYVDNICKEKKLSYSLLFDSMLAASESTDIPEWLNIIRIGLLYDDYKILVEELEVNRGIFYPVTYKNEPSFRSFFCRTYKKSKVVLPADREKDRRFYDNFIEIYPIYEVADNEKDYEEVVRKYNFYRKCINSRALLPCIKFRLKRIPWYIKHQYYYGHRSERIVEEANEYLIGKHKAGAKYIFIPGGKKLSKEIRNAELYKETKKCLFAGYEISCIKKAEEWCRQYWDEKRMTKLKERPRNVVLQNGMETLRRVQLTALDILVEFDRICTKHDIKYIIAAGTLLGAVRHKGFVPWDDDVDVFMLYEEWKKFEEIYKKEMDLSKFFVRTQETDRDDNLCFFQIKRNGTVFCKEGRMEYNSHPGVFMDILPYFNSSNNYLAHRVQEKICKWLKTVTWAHMGAQSEKRFWKRKYYEFLQKHISNKKSSELFFKVANRYRQSEYLCYPYVVRNPFKKGANQRKYFTQLTRLEFEGHTFYAPKEYEEFLEYTYSKDYMRYPAVEKQFNHHFPAHIDLGEIHAEVSNGKD